MKMKKRLFAILLALCVAFTMMPLAGIEGMTAYAERSYTLTLPSTYVEDVPRNHENDAEVNGRSCRSEAPNGGNSASV